MSKQGKNNSTESQRHPYIQSGKYVKLFGHLIKSNSTPEFIKRFQENMEADRQAKRGKLFV